MCCLASVTLRIAHKQDILQYALCLSNSVTKTRWNITPCLIDRKNTLVFETLNGYGRKVTST